MEYQLCHSAATDESSLSRATHTEHQPILRISVVVLLHLEQLAHPALMCSMPHVRYVPALKRLHFRGHYVR